MLTVYILHQKTELLSNPYKLCTGTGKKQPFKFNTLMPLYITPVLQGGQISPMINSLFMATQKFAPLPLSPKETFRFNTTITIICLQKSQLPYS